MADKCPVCKIEDHGIKELPGGGSRIGWACPRCGDFFLDDDLAIEPLLNRILENDTQRAVLSHWIRTKHESICPGGPGDGGIIVTPELIANIIKQAPPSCAEQADKFILWLGSSSRPGEDVSVCLDTHQSVVGAMSPDGFRLVLRYLMDKGLLPSESPTLDAGQVDVSLTFEGWQYYEGLRRGAADSHRAFMAMKYGDEQLDKLFESVFKPAVKETGFDLFRLIDRPKAGLIDNRLRVEIQTSRFLIADLTHENPGAYWEAGYAEGLGKPVIYTCEKNRFETCKTHFDTNHHLTLQWDSHGSTEMVEELKATIRATLPAEAKLTDG